MLHSFCSGCFPYSFNKWGAREGKLTTIWGIWKRGHFVESHVMSSMMLINEPIDSPTHKPTSPLHPSGCSPLELKNGFPNFPRPLIVATQKNNHWDKWNQCQTLSLATKVLKPAIFNQFIKPPALKSISFCVSSIICKPPCISNGQATSLSSLVSKTSNSC